MALVIEVPIRNVGASAFNCSKDSERREYGELLANT